MPIHFDSYGVRLGFKENWLYVRQGDTLHRLKAWPIATAETRSNDGSWCPVTMAVRDRIMQDLEEDFLGFSHLRPYHDNRNHIVADGAFWEQDTGQGWMPEFFEDRQWTFLAHHWYRFVLTVPECLLALADCLWCDLLSSLDLFREVPDAMDLALRDSQLATAIARHWEFPAIGCVDWQTARQKVHLRRRDILGWFGAQGTEAIVNALRRIPLRPSASLGPRGVADRIRCVLRLLGDPDWSPLLSGLTQPTTEVIDCLGDPLTAQWVDPARQPRDSRRMGERVLALICPVNRLIAAGILAPEAARKIPLRSTNDRTTARFLPHFSPHRFRHGPVPASASFIQLSTAQELYAEGQEMEHCLGSVDMLLHALKGDVVFYRVNIPLRATMALAMDSQEVWWLSEVNGPRNSQVPSYTRHSLVELLPPEIRVRQRWSEDEPPQDAAPAAGDCVA